jgi:hypothetical protein
MFTFVYRINIRYFLAFIRNYLSDSEVIFFNEIIESNFYITVLVSPCIQNVSFISSIHQTLVNLLRMGSTGSFSGFRKYGLRTFLIFLKISRILSKNEGPLFTSTPNQIHH